MFNIKYIICLICLIFDFLFDNFHLIFNSKMGANYAPAILPTEKAKTHGCSQVDKIPYTVHCIPCELD